MLWTCTIGLFALFYMPWRTPYPSRFSRKVRRRAPRAFALSAPMIVLADPGIQLHRPVSLWGLYLGGSRGRGHALVVAAWPCLRSRRSAWLGLGLELGD